MNIYLGVAMEALGLTLAWCIGLLLGLIGGGGSMLTIPVLVYIMGIVPQQAITYALFIVGATAAVGFVSYLNKSQVDFKVAMAFALPSIAAVFLARIFFLPAIPEFLFLPRGIEISKNMLLMLLFASLLLFSSLHIILNKDKHFLNKKRNQASVSYSYVSFLGFLIGIFTGIIGTGGGFLIVPILIFFGGLSMKQAVATSLLIVSTNSLTGFLTDLKRGVIIDWGFLTVFSLLAFAGIICGAYLSRRIEGRSLQQIFGWFTFVVSIFILVKEMYIYF